ncbi:MAG: YXWGXW repeat-containing protein [Terracidiphilus sp.]
MRSFRFSRLMLLALLVCLIPASSYAGVFISVGFAPPALPVYEQPPCPQPGWMWTPGYWAYGPDGYYWVPGTWVPAPYVGALWTPGYWGWNAGLYAWHPGYWGPHVGYYGGVNYGFGFFGIGFAGGAWRGGVFAYNTAVVRVNTTVIRNTYVDNTYVHNTIVNNNRVAFSGGPGGINHPPTPEERMAEHDQHMQPTAFQEQHRASAMQDRGSYFNNNHGRPSNTAMARPMGGNAHQNPGTINYNASKSNTGNVAAHPSGQGNQGGHPQPQVSTPHNNPQPQNQGTHNNPQPQSHTQPSKPQPQSHGGQGNQGHDHGKDR